MGLLFFAIGVPTALQCMGGNEHKIWYEGPKFTEQTSGQTLPSGDTVECFGPEAEGGLRGYCTVQITVTKTMPGPVYVMYVSSSAFVVCFVSLSAFLTKTWWTLRWTAVLVATGTSSMDFTRITTHTPRPEATTKPTATMSASLTSSWHVEKTRGCWQKGPTEKRISRTSCVALHTLGSALLLRSSVVRSLPAPAVHTLLQVRTVRTGRALLL